MKMSKRTNYYNGAHKNSAEELLRILAVDKGKRGRTIWEIMVMLMGKNKR